jgi:hypothetical protein
MVVQINMKEIGGFLELEMQEVKFEYHSDAVRFNLARNALSVYFVSAGCEQVYLPAYCCSSLSDALDEAGISYCFYNIDSRFEPVSLPSLEANEYFLYVNYFGIKEKAVRSLIEQYGNQLVVDNSQSFFSLPQQNGAAIYSARKFFGVPDGAYLYKPVNISIEEATLHNSDFNTEHLIQRIESGPQNSYQEYRASERRLRNAGVAKMSNFTQRILSCIDYDMVAKKRVNNFNALHDALKGRNLLVQELGAVFDIDEDTAVPMIYPFLCKDGKKLREYLIRNNVFVAMYWADVLSNEKSSVLERQYAENILPLPIDQRYSTTDMQRVINIIRSFYE